MNVLPLSPVDYVFCGIGSQPVTFAFYYPLKLDPQLLQKSLQEVLKYFTPLQSRLSRISQTDGAAMDTL